MNFEKWFRKQLPNLDEVIRNSSYRLIRDSRYRRSFKRRLYERFGYNYDHWLRTAQIEDWKKTMKSLGPENLDALEISPGDRVTWRNIGFRSYEAVQYPDFDICEMTTGKIYDVVIADNILEHVKRPHQAVLNVYRMLKPGGIFYVTTPFLVQVHGEEDYFRWTMKGMRVMLEEAGFLPDGIETKSWGNRDCVKANFDDWAVHGWRRNMRNESNLPVTVWATARRGRE